MQRKKAEEKARIERGSLRGQKRKVRKEKEDTKEILHDQTNSI